MLSLIAKDFKLIFQGSNTNKIAKLLGIVFTIVVGAILIVVETYIFNSIFQKLKDVKDASVAYFSVFLFVISTILTIFGLIVAKKLFFNKEDSVRLQSMPISNFKLVASKLFFLFITMFSVNLVFNLPLFITYGIINRVYIFFYFKAIFYPILLFFFQAGVALLLVYPYKLLNGFLDKHVIAKLVTYLVVAFILAILYSMVLNFFVNIVIENNTSALFTVEAMETTKEIAKYMIPVNFLIDGFISDNLVSILIAFGISFAVFSLGTALISIFYNRFLQRVVYRKETHKEDVVIKASSPLVALIKKEIILLFRNSSLLISFVTLLAVEPLISYLIIQSINTIFLNGAMSYYLIALPGIIPNLDITLLMLITTIIYQGVNNYISSENKGIRLMKSIPISAFKQLLVKVSAPFILSSSFVFISYAVQVITRDLTNVTATYGLVLNWILLFIITLVDLYEELSLKRFQTKNALLSTTFTYLAPLVFLATATLLMYAGVNSHIVYLGAIGVFALLTLPFLIKFKTRITKKFLNLEVIN